MGIHSVQWGTSIFTVNIFYQNIIIKVSELCNINISLVQIYIFLYIYFLNSDNRDILQSVKENFFTNISVPSYEYMIGLAS